MMTSDKTAKVIINGIKYPLNPGTIDDYIDQVKKEAYDEGYKKGYEDCKKFYSNK